MEWHQVLLSVSFCAARLVELAGRHQREDVYRMACNIYAVAHASTVVFSFRPDEWKPALVFADSLADGRMHHDGKLFPIGLWKLGGRPQA